MSSTEQQRGKFGLRHAWSSWRKRWDYIWFANENFKNLLQQLFPMGAPLPEVAGELRREDAWKPNSFKIESVDDPSGKYRTHQDEASSRWASDFLGSAGVSWARVFLPILSSSTVRPYTVSWAQWSQRHRCKGSKREGPWTGRRMRGNTHGKWAE